MKRYKIGHGGYFESDVGKWVRYEDTVDLQASNANLKLRLEDAQAEIERLRAEAKGGDIMAEKDAERIAELETYIEDQTRVWLEQRKRINILEEGVSRSQSRIQAMYEALVASGSINRIPEAHEWVGK